VIKLPAESYPFTIQAISTLTGDVVWEQRVEMPDGAVQAGLHIPPLAKQIGCPVQIKLLWPDGSVTEKGVWN
jgi:hypothetical protein